MYCDMLEITAIYCRQMSFPDSPFSAIFDMRSRVHNLTFWFAHMSCTRESYIFLSHIPVQFQNRSQYSGMSEAPSASKCPACSAWQRTCIRLKPPSVLLNRLRYSLRPAQQVASNMSGCYIYTAPLPRTLTEE